MKRIGAYLFHLRLSAEDRNVIEIIDMLEEDKRAKVLDLGCYEGTITKEVARRVKARYIFGIDIMQNALLKAKQKGIETIRADINFNLPFADKFKVDSLIGIGLYPFPPLFSRFLEILDPIHANFITIKVRKADNP